MDAALRAGVALFTAGEYHAAHDPWEAVWLDLESGTDDERLLHGLIQYTAALHHASGRNWSGATGLAGSARAYLADLPPDYRGVNVGDVRPYLAGLAADPERVERGPPVPLTLDGRALALAELGDDPDAAALAAEAIVEEYDRYDEDVVERAIGFARDEVAAEERGETVSTRFVALVADFVGDAPRRDLIYRRLADHVERRVQRERDVDGLFE